ncbi:MAG TPA: hypothetical protein VGB71_12840 [Flavisolibacter sp.]
MRVLLGAFCVFFCLTSCLNNKQDDPTAMHPDVIFHDYKLTADEDRGDVTMMLQYRLNGPEGEPFLLNEPSKVSLDGIELKADSAKLAGTFYEFSRPIQDFRGSHTIIFTDSRGKEHKAAFAFEPFMLAEELSEQISKSPFAIKLADFPKDPTPIRLVMIDTAYATTDVNEEMRIRDGIVPIDGQKLANLVKGPITLEVYREEEKPLQGISKKGGRISITYGLRRQFELVD